MWKPLAEFACLPSSSYPFNWLSLLVRDRRVMATLGVIAFAATLALGLRLLHEVLAHGTVRACEEFFYADALSAWMVLLISAVSTNSDRAMAIVPVSLIPQLVFAGALVPYGHMLDPAKAVSQLMISKWALQLTGSLTDLSDRFAAQFPASFAQPYADQFDSNSWLPWAVLAAFFIGMLAATVIVQKQKDVL